MLLIADGFEEFVWLVGGTNIPVGVVVSSIILRSSHKLPGNGESYHRSAILVGEKELSFSDS